MEARGSNGGAGFQLVSDMRMDIGEPPLLAMVAVSSIAVDESYQRALKVSRVRKIAREFDWARFSAVTLARRADSGYDVVDGQHRVEAIRRRGDIRRIPCVIFEPSDPNSPQEAASAFLGINRERGGVAALDRHRAALVAQDEMALEISAACAHYGIEIKASTESGQIAAVSALEEVYRAGGAQHVSDVLHLIIYGLNENREYKQGAGIRAISLLLRQVKRLERDSFDAQAFSKRFTSRTEQQIHKAILKAKGQSIKVRPESEYRAALISLHDFRRAAKAKIAERLLALGEL